MSLPAFDLSDDDDDDAPELSATITDPRKARVRFSALKLIKCPAKYRHAILTGFDPSFSQKLGTVGHAVTLEPHRIVVFEPGEWTDDKGKTKPHKGKKQGGAWEQFKARPANIGKVIVTPKQLKIATGIAESLRSHEQAGPLLFGPHVIREQQILWAHDGREYSSLPDAREPGVQVTDLKTCRSAEPERFVWDILRMYYKEQLRLYDEADAYECGEDYLTRRPIALNIVAVESAPPFVVQVYTLHQSAKRAADTTIANWRGRLRNCESTNHWPGYAQSAWPITDDEPENNFPGDDDIDDESEPFSLEGF